MNKRLKINIGTLNFARGISIFLIVVLHTIRPILQNERIMIFSGFSSALVPFFFVISGYLFTPKSVPETLRSTASTMMIPVGYVMIANLILYPFRVIWSGGSYLQGIKTMGLAILLGASDDGVFMGIPYVNNGPIWFLIALFVGWNILNLIMTINNQKVRVALIIASSLAGYLLSRAGIVFWCIQGGLIAVGYLAAGYYMKKMKNGIPTPVRVVILAGAILSLLFSFMSIAENKYAYGIPDLLGALCCSYFLLLACIFLNSVDLAVIDGIESCGRYSLLVLCIHSVLFTSLPWHMFYTHFGNPLVGAGLLLIYNFVVIMAVGYVLDRIKRKKMKRKEHVNG